ncbi:MAG: hypothetical protein ACOCZ9_00255 [Spirochaetota bacterium]
MRMNIRTLLSVTMLFFVGIGSAFADPLEDADYEVLNIREEDDVVRRELRGPDGNEMEVRGAEDELTESQVNTLEVIRRTVFGLEGVDVASMNVLFDEEYADILVVPGRLEYDGQDLVPYVPSGLRFRFDRVLEYNFRVRVDEYFLRFQGQYVDEEQFLSRLADAVNDPVAFLESQRPEILAQRIGELEESLSELEDRLVGEQQDLDDRVRNNSSDISRNADVINENSNAVSENAEEIDQNVEEISRNAEGVDANAAVISETEGELETAAESIASLEENLDEAMVAIEDIRQEGSELEGAVGDLRAAVLAFNNRSFLFRQARPLEPEVVERIVEMRREQPDIEISEIRDRLSEDGMSASNNEVEIVLATYFNQFE